MFVVLFSLQSQSPIIYIVRFLCFALYLLCWRLSSDVRQFLFCHDNGDWGSWLNLRPTIAFSGSTIWETFYVIIFLCLFPWASHILLGVLFQYPAWRTKVWLPAFWKLAHRWSLEVLSIGCIINHSMPSIIPVYSMSKTFFYSLQRINLQTFDEMGKSYKEWGKGAPSEKCLFFILLILPFHLFTPSFRVSGAAGS